MNRKAKVLHVGAGPVPVRDKERRRSNKYMASVQERLRRRHPEVHGKVVDYINYWFEEGILFVTVRFKDETDFSMEFVPGTLVQAVELSDIKTGDFHLIKQYYRRRDS